MQRPRTLAAVLLVGLLALPMAGCEISFSVTEDLPVHTIEGGVLDLPDPIETSWSMDVSQQPEYRSRSFDHIKEVWIRDLVLEIKGTPGGGDTDETWAFLASVEISIFAEIDGTPTEETVAWVPNGDPQVDDETATQTLEFRTTNVELLPFIEAEGGYEVRIEYNGQTPSEDIDVGGIVQYRLKVGR